MVGTDEVEQPIDLRPIDAMEPVAARTGVNGSRDARRGISAGQAARIAWHRARAFSLVSRVPVLGAVIAPWLWPMHLAVVAGQGDQIRHRNSASMAVSDGARHRMHRPSMAFGVIALLAQFAFLVGVSTILATALLPVLSPAAAGTVTFFLAAFPFLLEGPIKAAIKLTQNRESLTLNRRRRELAEHGQAFVMTSFVRSAKKTAKGDGRALLNTMKTEWRAQRAVVIFYPANAALARYYADAGGIHDVGAKHRMRFDYQKNLLRFLRLRRS